MKIINEPREMQRWCALQPEIGFVPTMGALHDGHLALCRRAKSENARLVASVFVNPTQFAPNEDLSRYPRPFERDCELLRELGCDALFAPQASAMYGESTQTVVSVPKLAERWEGELRPGHFEGVATIVAKLFNIVRPTRAYFGEKDYQQLRVLQQMRDDLFFDLQIVPCETQREADGLAMSSRNVYLSPQEREAAPVLFQAMQAARHAARNGEANARELQRVMQRVVETQPLVSPQYLAVVDARTLEPLETLDGREARLLVAAKLGATRLIDNMAL